MSPRPRHHAFGHWGRGRWPHPNDSGTIVIMTATTATPTRVPPPCGFGNHEAIEVRGPDGETVAEWCRRCGSINVHVSTGYAGDPWRRPKNGR